MKPTLANSAFIIEGKVLFPGVQEDKRHLSCPSPSVLSRPKSIPTAKESMASTSIRDEKMWVAAKFYLGILWFVKVVSGQ